MQDLPHHAPAGLVALASSVLPTQKHEKAGFNKADGWSVCVPGTGQTASHVCPGLWESLLPQQKGDSKD